jgi:ferredoxin-NADP reductase
MARTALRRGLSWQRAEVLALHRETQRAYRLSLRPPNWPGHVPGQHVDVRLTAEDGYTAQRSYSIASAPQRAGIELVVERLEEGEVSPYLTDVLRVGDLLELRGPVGGYFIWPSGSDRPVQLIAGGSGVVPSYPCLAITAPPKAPCRCGCCTPPEPVTTSLAEPSWTTNQPLSR